MKESKAPLPILGRQTKTGRRTILFIFLNLLRLRFRQVVLVVKNVEMVYKDAVLYVKIPKPN